MNTIVDHNNVVLFNDLIKIYLFKEEKKVKVSFKITDYIVTHFSISQDQFEEILAKWKTEDGIQGMETNDCGKIWWYYNDCGPRPARLPASYVTVSFKRWNFRFSVAEMLKLKTEYLRQKNNKMHWDK